VPRPRHPDKEIEAAIAHAEAHGWRVETSRRGHAWGVMKCPNNDPECRCGDCCITSIWSTPKNAHAHARTLRRVVDNCTSPADAVEGRNDEGR
jgi:hypothetical protein